MRAHTITTKASTIVPGGILALSFAVVLLAATASTASADRVLSPWYCPPLPTRPTTLDQVPLECLDLGARSFDFGDRQVGTTSPAQGFALGVFDTDALTPVISVSGDYAQTNNCPPTLSVTGEQVQGCLIMVTFTPTGTGPKHGTLSAGPGGPTVALTGNGVTTPTPSTLPPRPPEPLSLDVSGPKQKPEKKLTLSAYTSNDSTLVVRGSKIKKTTKQLKALEPIKFKARLKHLKRIKDEPTKPKIKIKAAATDEFGQTATDEATVTLCNQIVDVELGFGCRWHPSQK